MGKGTLNSINGRAMITIKDYFRTVYGWRLDNRQILFTANLHRLDSLQKIDSFVNKVWYGKNAKFFTGKKTVINYNNYRVKENEDGTYQLTPTYSIDDYVSYIGGYVMYSIGCSFVIAPVTNLDDITTIIFDYRDYQYKNNADRYSIKLVRDMVKGIMAYLCRQIGR